MVNWNIPNIPQTKNPMDVGTGIVITKGLNEMQIAK